MDQKKLISYQQKYFEILNEFFVEVTGKEARDFSDLDSFEKNISQMGEMYRNNVQRAERSLQAFSVLEDKLKSLYSAHGSDVFKIVQQLDCCKLNLGGSTRFLKTQLNATRKSLLFSDTVLIPDPILPFLERERPEERFSHLAPLQMAFFVLHLSNLISDDFDFLPFFIFPSFEKTLEENDKYTQEQSMKLMADVFNYYVDSGIQSLPDVIEFGDRYPDRFLQQVESSRLFVSPGQSAGESIASAIENYKSEMRHWRSNAWCEQHLTMTDSRIVCNAVFERILPQYHLLENSDELKSNPLLCIDAQAHYYKLICTMKKENIALNITNDISTNAIVNSLTSNRLDFLANINDSQIVELRKTNENVAFRRDLRELVNSLPTTRMDDIGYVASEVCSHVELLISKHNGQIKAINDKYQAKHKQTALIGIGSLAVTMMPVLAPFLSGLGFVATAGKYTADKLEQRNELRQASHSMMGVMSLAKKSSK